MTLQKMRYWDEEKKKLVVCAVDEVSRGSEFTICGNNCLDACKSEHDDWDIVGGSFSGKLQQVTCPKCLAIINFIKNLQ